MLVLSSALSKEDQMAINKFLDVIREQERKAILDKIDDLEKQSHATRTPLYQETLFKSIRNIVTGKADVFPPQSFRDKANGE